ncbi:S-phase kinase-associated protein 1-like [Haemaphysalis longicornis]
MAGMNDSKGSPGTEEDDHAAQDAVAQGPPSAAESSDSMEEIPAEANDEDDNGEAEGVLSDPESMVDEGAIDGGACVMGGVKRPLSTSSERGDHKRRPGVGEDDCEAEDESNMDAISSQGLPPLAQASISMEEIPPEENGPKIKLQSSDGKVFEVDVDVAMVSLTIKGMLEALGVDDDDVVPLPNVNAEVLEKVIVWLTYHKNDPTLVEEPPAGTWTPMKPKTYDTYVDPWDQAFLKVDQAMLFELISASLYLNIKSLKDAACKTVAKMMTGKTPAQLREMFRLECCSRSAQEKVVQEDNAWDLE